MKEKYLTSEDITSSMRISKEKLSLMIKQGLFPKPIKVNERTTLWSYAVIENWVAQQQQTQDWVNDSQDLDLF